MQTYDTAVARELAKLIHEAIERISEQISGGWVEDYPSYRQKVGQIEAMKAVLVSIEEAENNAKKR